jgi:hypothetical protein
MPAQVTTMSSLPKPFLLGHIEDHPVTEDTGAGNHNVELAEVVYGGLDNGLAALHGSNGLGAGDGRTAVFVDFGGHDLGDGLVEPGAVNVDAGVNDDHLRAFFGHEHGDATADTPAGAGDDGYLVFEQVGHDG